MKFKVVVFEPRIRELKKIHAILRSTNLDLDLYRASNVDNALRIINENEKFHLIILNVRMSPNRKINEHFLQTVVSRYASEKFLLLYANEKHREKMELIKLILEDLDYDPWMQLPLKLLDFVQRLEAAFPNLSEYQLTTQESKFCAMKRSELQAAGIAPCDIYIRLGSEKYVKVLKANDQFSNEFFSRFKEKGVGTFYVTNEELHTNFTKFFPPVLVNKKAFATEQEYAVGSAVALQGLVQEFGISEDVIETTATVVEETFSILEKNKLSSFLELLKNSDNSFLYDHGFLTSLICLETAKKFRWYSSKHNRIIGMASLLHDVHLTDSKQYAVELYGTEKSEGFSKEELTTFKNHPKSVAEELNKIMDIPSDVIGMIMKHHEGFGPARSYPIGHYSTQLSALECLFVMSHEVVLLFYRNLFHPDKIKSSLFAFWEEMHKGNFRKYIKGLEEVVNSMLLEMTGE